MEVLRIVLILVAIGASNVHAITVTPANPVPEHTLVRVSYKPGTVLLIFGIRDGQPSMPDMQDAGDGLTVFTGSPGVYVLGGLEDGQRFQTTVDIKGSGPDPPPPPPPVPPDPVPPLPEVAARVRALVSQIQNREHKLLAPRLAQSFEVAAASIAAGLDEKTVASTLRSAMHTALGTEEVRMSWKEVSLYTNGVLNSASGNKDAMYNRLSDISVGLKAAAGERIGKILWRS